MVTWLIERDLNDAAERIATVVSNAGGRLIRWSSGEPIPTAETPVFIGSLTECGGMPGVVGDPNGLRVSAWSEMFRDVALNTEFVWATVGTVHSIDVPWERVFVRPDSAMKPFAGRVLEASNLSPSALDHGFYYENDDLEIVLSPAVEVLDEWRFVAVDRQLVASSGYEAQKRTGRKIPVPADASNLAGDVARRCTEPTVVIDVARDALGGVKLVELNLFSGADFYDCDPTAIVDALSAALR